MAQYFCHFERSEESRFRSRQEEPRFLVASLLGMTKLGLRATELRITKKT